MSIIMSNEYRLIIFVNSNRYHLFQRDDNARGFAAYNQYTDVMLHAAIAQPIDRRHMNFTKELKIPICNIVSSIAMSSVSSKAKIA
jgi:hypothetical protein